MTQETITTRPADIDRGRAVGQHPRRRHGLAVVGLALAVLSLIFGAAQLARRDRADAARPTVETALSQMAARLDARAPLRMNASTVMTGAHADGRRLVTEFRISQDIPSADVEAAQARLGETDARELCGDPDMRGMIERGITFERRYRDTRGDPLRTETRTCAGRVGPAPSRPVAL